MASVRNASTVFSLFRRNR